MTNIFLDFEKEISTIIPPSFIAILVENQFKQKLIEDFSEFEKNKLFSMRLHLSRPLESLEYPLRWHAVALRAKFYHSVEVYLHDIPNYSSYDWILRHIRADSNDGLVAVADVLISVFHEVNNNGAIVKILKRRNKKMD